MPGPTNPTSAVALPLAVLPGWGIEHGGDRSGWWFRPAGSLSGERIAECFPRSAVYRALSVRFLWFGLTFRYGRRIVTPVRTAADFAAAVAALSREPGETAFARRLTATWGHRN